MSRTERSDGSIRLVTILSPEAALAIDVIMRFTGASEKAVVDQMLIDAAGFRTDAALGTKIILRRTTGDYLVRLPKIKTEIEPEEDDREEKSKVVQFRPQSTTPNTSA